VKKRAWVTAVEADPRLRAAEVEIAGFISVMDAPEPIRVGYLEAQIVSAVTTLVQCGYFWHDESSRELVFTLPAKEMA
jgi:hypothetical protein